MRSAYYPGVDPSRPLSILILRKSENPTREAHFSKLQSFDEHSPMQRIHLALDGWRKLFPFDTLRISTTQEYLRASHNPLPYNPAQQRILLEDL
jgi:hypothetical protein